MAPRTWSIITPTCFPARANSHSAAGRISRSAATVPSWDPAARWSRRRVTGAGARTAAWRATMNASSARWMRSNAGPSHRACAHAARTTSGLTSSNRRSEPSPPNRDPTLNCRRRAGGRCTARHPFTPMRSHTFTDSVRAGRYAAPTPAEVLGANPSRTIALNRFMLFIRENQQACRSLGGWALQGPVD